MFVLEIIYFAFLLTINVLAKKNDWRIINYLIEEWGWLLSPLMIFLIFYIHLKVFDVPMSQRFYVGKKRCGNAELGYLVFHGLYVPFAAFIFQIICDFIRARINPNNV